MRNTSLAACLVPDDVEAAPCWALAARHPSGRGQRAGDLIESSGFWPGSSRTRTRSHDAPNRTPTTLGSIAAVGD
jgi:hypothetical protein